MSQESDPNGDVDYSGLAFGKHQLAAFKPESNKGGILVDLSKFFRPLDPLQESVLEMMQTSPDQFNPLAQLIEMVRRAMQAGSFDLLLGELRAVTPAPLLPLDDEAVLSLCTCLCRVLQMTGKKAEAEWLEGQCGAFND